MWRLPYLMTIYLQILGTDLALCLTFIDGVLLSPDHKTLGNIIFAICGSSWGVQLGLHGFMVFSVAITALEDIFYISYYLNPEEAWLLPIEMGFSIAGHTGSNCAETILHCSPQSKSETTLTLIKGKLSIFACIHGATSTKTHNNRLFNEGMLKFCTQCSGPICLVNPMPKNLDFSNFSCKVSYEQCLKWVSSIMCLWSFWSGESNIPSIEVKQSAKSVPNIYRYMVIRYGNLRITWSHMVDQFPVTFWHSE